MKKLKSPESYIKYGVEGYTFRDIIDNTTDEDIIDSMIEMQVDAYNQAIEDAIIYLANTQIEYPTDLDSQITDLNNFKLSK